MITQTSAKTATTLHSGRTDLPVTKSARLHLSVELLENMGSGLSGIGKNKPDTLIFGKINLTPLSVTLFLQQQTSAFGLTSTRNALACQRPPGFGDDCALALTMIAVVEIQYYPVVGSIKLVGPRGIRE